MDKSYQSTNNIPDNKYIELVNELCILYKFADHLQNEQTKNNIEIQKLLDINSNRLNIINTTNTKIDALLEELCKYNDKLNTNNFNINNQINK